MRPHHALLALSWTTSRGTFGATESLREKLANSCPDFFFFFFDGALWNKNTSKRVVPVEHGPCRQTLSESENVSHLLDFFFFRNKLNQSRQADGAKFTPVIASKGLMFCRKSRLMFRLFNVNALKTGITVACTMGLEWYCTKTMRKHKIRFSFLSYGPCCRAIVPDVAHILYVCCWFSCSIHNIADLSWCRHASCSLRTSNTEIWLWIFKHL